MEIQTQINHIKLYITLEMHSTKINNYIVRMWRTNRSLTLYDYVYTTTKLKMTFEIVLFLLRNT